MLITILLIAGGMAVTLIALYRTSSRRAKEQRDRQAAALTYKTMAQMAQSQARVVTRRSHGRTLTPLREEVREQTRPLHDNGDSVLSTVLTVLAVEAMMQPSNDAPAAFDSSPAPDTPSSFAGFGGGDSGGGGGGGSWDGGGSSDSGASFDSGSSGADSSSGSW